MVGMFVAIIVIITFMMVLAFKNTPDGKPKAGKLTFYATGSQVRVPPSPEADAAEWNKLLSGYPPQILLYFILSAASGAALVGVQDLFEIAGWRLATIVSGGKPGGGVVAMAWVAAGLVLGALGGVSLALVRTHRERYGHPVWFLLAAAVATGAITVNARYAPLLANALAVGATPDVQWVAMPPGDFKMGSDNSREVPIHAVDLDGFEIAKTEVTVAQYRACVGAGACSTPVSSDLRCNWNKVGRDDYPIDCVTHDQAKAYSKFVGGRLPSEAEWEYAARSGGEAVVYPWGGGTADRVHLVMRGDCEGCSWLGSLPVCSRPLGNTTLGLCDMSGNVFEWVEDVFFDSYSGAPADGSAREVDGATNHVVRGGGWDSTPESLRVTARATTSPTSSYAGFRPVRDVPGTFVITAGQDDDSDGNCVVSFPESPQSPAEKTPATIQALRGEHRVLVTCEKGKREKRIRLRAGETKELTFTILTKPSTLVPWVPVPAGSFRMGSWWGQKDERPVHEVTLSSFEMAKTEVTVAQYRACVESGGCEPADVDGGCTWQKADGDKLPMNCVSWEQAQAFSRWVGGRLPTEAEWEYASRDLGAKGRYPWGDGDATCAYVVMNSVSGPGCGEGSALPVCSRQAGNNALELCDMAGNVWEWVADWYAEDAYRNATNRDPTGPVSGAKKVLRGGAYTTDRTDAFKGTFRFFAKADERLAWFGFRPVRSAPAP